MEKVESDENSEKIGQKSEETEEKPTAAPAESSEKDIIDFEEISTTTTEATPAQSNGAHVVDEQKTYAEVHIIFRFSSVLSVTDNL